MSTSPLLDKNTQAALDLIQNGNVVAVITDLDGTAVRSTLRLQVAQEVMAETYGVTFDMPALFAHASKSGSFAFPKLLKIAGHPEDAELIAQKCYDRFVEKVQHADTTPLVADHFPALMKVLKEKGIPLVACTNAESQKIAELTAGIPEKAAQIKLGGLFYSGMPHPADKAVVLRGKPYEDMAVEGFKAVAAESCARAPKDVPAADRPVVIVVGDQPADAASAAAADVYMRAHGARAVFLWITGSSTPDVTPEPEIQEHEQALASQGAPYLRHFGPLVQALAANVKIKATNIFTRTPRGGPLATKTQPQA